MELNQIVEDFSLGGIDAEGNEKEFSLSDFRGKNVILYFYPKDETPGCTQEACEFRDNFNRITSKATVIGVSADSIDSHKKFQKNHELNFVLLSDPEHKILEKFGVWGEKMMYGKPFLGIIRSTFLIDKKGVLKKAWTKVNVKRHVDDVIIELENLE